MNKKIILTFIIMFLALSNVKALSFKGGDIIDNVFVLKIDENDKKEYKKGQFIIDDKNEFVYCLEAFVKVNNEASYNIYESDFPTHLNMSSITWKQVNLIAYYGYKYKDVKHDHSDPKWYYITQMLIWETMSPNAKFYFTDSFEGPINTSLFVKEKEEIMALVNTHDVIPFFADPNAYIGEEVTLIDQNNVLDRYQVMGNYQVTGNKITLKLKTKTNIIPVKKATNKTAIVYESSNSQNILKGYQDYPISIDYHIKGKTFKGTISIKKYGETLSGEYKPLANVFILLYDSKKKYLASICTNESGEGLFNDLEEGKYYIRETNAPYGYLYDSTYKEVNVTKENENVHIELRNKLKKGTINVRIIDEENNPVSSSLVKITSDNTLIYEGTTSATGTISIPNLVMGIYEIKQISTKDNLNIDENTYELSLDEDKDLKELLIENKLKRGTINIRIIDEENNPVSSSLVKITLNNKLVYEGPTSATGTINIPNLITGTYKIKQISTKDNLILDKKTYKLTISENKELKELLIENKLKRGTIKISVIDEDKTKVPNSFILVTKGNTLIFDGITNKKGNITIPKLTFGSYQIKQITTSQNLILDKNIYELSIKEDKELKELIIINNFKKGTINVRVIDEENNPVSSSIIKITLNNKLVYEGATSSEGIINIPNLKIGRYEIKQISTKDNLVLDKNTYKLTINEDKELKELIIENKLNTNNYIEISDIPDTFTNIEQIIMYNEEKRVKKYRNIYYNLI